MNTTFQFEAIGTHWNIILTEELTPSVSLRVEQSIMERIAVFDLAYSRFRDDSLVSTMAHTAGTYKLPPDGPALLMIYERIYKITNGKVTPLIGKVMEEAGYDKTYSLTPSVLHAPPSWDDVLVFDGVNLTLKQSALLDFGAAGKGYLVDHVAKVLLGEGIESFIIDAGGDIIHRHTTGAKAQIGLEHPLDTTKVIGVVSLGNESICGSAGNRRAWGDFTHIIDPTTLTSPDEILATWVIAETTLVADMLATCLFFISPEILTSHFTFQYIILRKDFSVLYSKQTAIELYV